MSLLSMLFAAGSLVAVSALPVDADSYTVMSGKAVAANWPSVSNWIPSFDDMFQNNMGVIRHGCSQWGVPSNSNEEISSLKEVINQVSVESSVDARFILAVVLQESNACVRAPTTSYGHRNPGLMQSHMGDGTCNEGGKVQNPCPEDEILTMIRDGVKGTVHGDGLVQILGKTPSKSDMKYYEAARMYNSGSIDASGDLEKGIATHCYVSDVANRLTGWVNSATKCPFDRDGILPPPKESPSKSEHGAATKSQSKSTLSSPVTPTTKSTTTQTPPVTPIQSPISSPTMIVPSSPSPVQSKISVSSKTSSQSKTTAQATTTAPPKAPEVQPVSSQKSVAITMSVQPSVHSWVVSNMRAPGVTENCSKYYRVQTGDYCLKVAQKAGITFAKLRALNTAINVNCSNLWLGYDYCVQ